MIELQLHNRQRRWPLNLNRFQPILEAALDLDAASPPRHPPRHYEISVTLVGARAMRALNERFLHHPGPTDVITFDYGESPAAETNVAWVRGDLVLCPDVAAAQARQFRSSWTAELVRYAVHGLLHLRGFDDHTPAQRQTMKREENRRVRHLAGRFDFSRLAKLRRRAP